jgi:hypothetical protein
MAVDFPGGLPYVLLCQSFSLLVERLPADSLGRQVPSILHILMNKIERKRK